MKLGNPIFLIGVMVVAVAGATYVVTARDESPVVHVPAQPTAEQIEMARLARAEEYRVATERLIVVRSRWQDALKLADVTPRIQLPPIVEGMQKQGQELDAMLPTLPACHQAAAKHLRASQNASVDLALAFMKSRAHAMLQQSKADPATELALFDSALSACRPG